MPKQPGVILIEDHPLIRVGQRMLLEEAGFRVTEITKAADLADFAAVAGEYQAIIADFELGPDMTGIEIALDIMRRVGERIPTLVVSASFGGGTLAAAAANGMPLMAQPAREEEIMAWVGQNLEEPQT